jgi:uncharacterized membrane-anchored protein YjiN (DUF445 family)
MGDKRINRLGSVSLAAAILGFLVVELQPWIPLAAIQLFGGLTLKGLFEAFFEASMAGAVADWFAVTALFKDPLGMRLPHTNILAKNKDTIADAVPRFLTGFVNSKEIASELGKIDYASKASEILAAGGPREELHSFLRSRSAEFLTAYGLEGQAASAERFAALRRFAGELLGFIADRVDAPAEASALLAWARKERFDEKALEAVAEYARAEIGRNRVRLVAILTPMVKRNSGWQGLFIGSSTVERFLSGMQDELAEIKADKTNDFRRFVLSSISSYASELAAGKAGSGGRGGDRSGGPARERLAAAFREALTDEAFRDGFARFLAQLLSRLGEDLSGAEGRFIPSLELVEDALASKLQADEALRSGLNAMVSSLIAAVIERGRVVEGVTEYLAGLLRATDERVFVKRIEESVWNDLQYIRLNGAVVGGFVGIAITTIKAALSG